MKKSKLSNILLFVFYILAIAVVVYPFTKSYDTAKRYYLFIALIAMVVILFIRLAVDLAHRKKAAKAYVPLRNVTFDKSTDAVLVVNGKTVYTKDYSEVFIKENVIPSFNDDDNTNLLPEPKTDVTVLHIDNVDDKKLVIKLFKEQVPALDYLRVINS